MYSSISVEKLVKLFGFLTIVSLITIWLVLVGKLAIAMMFLLFMLPSFFFFTQKRIDVFDPFTIFSFSFFSVIVVSWHLYNTNFENSLFIQKQSFSIGLHRLFAIALTYTVVSYVSVFLGYKTFAKIGEITIDFRQDNISLKVVEFFIVVFAIIGLSNFIINLCVFAGGNPLTYMANIAVRHLEWQTGGTTLFYHLSYLAGYLWLYKFLRHKKGFSFAFYSYIALTIFMKATTGRIYGTIAYFLSYIVIIYYANKKVRENSYRYLFLFVFVVLISLGFYFFRVTSSLSYSSQLSEGYLTSIQSYLNFETLQFFVIDKGNLPNVAVLMKILEGWGRDIPFLYGESLFTWIYGFLPSFIRPDGYQPSVMIKKVWYSHIVGGALPPTGMGEMFANFGYYGALAMYFFGAFCAFLRNLLHKFNNFWCLLIYSNIVLGFVVLYPKGEFDNLSLWQILPALMAYLLLVFTTKLVKVSNISRYQ